MAMGRAVLLALLMGAMSGVAADVQSERQANQPAPSGPLRPAEKSPLASDGTRVFAVAQDGETLLVTPIGSGGTTWQPLARLAGAKVGGLAWSLHRLFASDAN